MGQLAVATEYDSLYDPIVGASDGHGRDAAPTPELQLNRTFKVKGAYEELKTELMDEITQIEDRMIKPAIEARDCIAPIRKTIKKRENKRLDLERCQDKVNKLQRKAGRTPKEETALGKAEDELSVLANEFDNADMHLRNTLPPLIAASFSLVPPLLAEHILIQNRLLGLYYTTLHTCCEEVGFPSPPPPMEEVVADWNAAFRPVQREMESTGLVSRGKAVHMSMSLGADGQPHQPAQSPKPGMSPFNSFRRSSSALIPGNKSNDLNGKHNEPPQQHRLRIASSGSAANQRPDHLTPTDFTAATVLGRSPGASPSSLMPPNDYFGGRRPSTASTVASNMSQLSLTNGTAGAAAAKKKKPPPPPPPKRIPSTQQLQEYVVAMFDYAGQNDGDLSFREGDRIKIVRKTKTDQDWWDGELAGQRGKFPANYTRAL
jgi:hypothetical protein